MTAAQDPPERLQPRRQQREGKPNLRGKAEEESDHRVFQNNQISNVRVNMAQYSSLFDQEKKKKKKY